MTMRNGRPAVAGAQKAQNPEEIDEESGKPGDSGEPGSAIVLGLHSTPLFEPFAPFCGPMPFLQVMPDDFFGALENNFSNIFVSMPIYVKCRDLRPVSP
jgi:hypothetical protein